MEINKVYQKRWLTRDQRDPKSNITDPNTQTWFKMMSTSTESNRERKPSLMAEYCYIYYQSIKTQTHWDPSTLIWLNIICSWPEWDTKWTTEDLYSVQHLPASLCRVWICGLMGQKILKINCWWKKMMTRQCDACFFACSVHHWVGTLILKNKGNSSTVYDKLMEGWTFSLWESRQSWTFHLNDNGIIWDIHAPSKSGKFLK